MNIQHRFLEYAEAFERAYTDNDWSCLEPYFTQEATYDSGIGEPAHGLPAVLSKLQGAVDSLDRLMDTRTLELAPSSVDGDTVRTDWTVAYSKSGVPDLQVSGTEYARFEGDRIAQLWDELHADTIQTFGTWFAQHGQSLSAQ